MFTDFDMASDRHGSRVKQGHFCTVFFTEEDPVASFSALEVFLLAPTGSLVSVSPFGPSEQSLNHFCVDTSKGFLAHHVSVIQRPAPKNGIEYPDESASGHLTVGLNERPNASQMLLHAFETLVKVV